MKGTPQKTKIFPQIKSISVILMVFFSFFLLFLDNEIFVIVDYSESQWLARRGNILSQKSVTFSQIRVNAKEQLALHLMYEEEMSS